MRKIILFLICISVFVPIATAKTVYVNGATGNDANTGLSWAQAVQTVAHGASLTVLYDNLWVTSGTYNISNATVFNPLFHMYGGFLGNEGSTAARAKSDLDGNGIVEPWEFTNATVLSFNSTGLTGMQTSYFNFDGFTLSGSAVKTTVNPLYQLNDNNTFVNNTIKNNTVTLTVNSDATYYPFVKAVGKIKDCLIEKNSVTVNAISIATIQPFIHLNSSTHPTVGSKFSNNIIRNNTVTIDYSTAGAISPLYTRGMILAVQPALDPTVATGNTGGLSTTVANCLIHNNLVNFLPGVGATSYLPAAAIICLYNPSTYNAVYAPSTDSIINCTVVNNKCSRVEFGGLNVLAASTDSKHNIINNVFYNNQTAVDGTSYSVNNMAINSANNTGVISNNFTNGGGLTNSSPQIVNQDNTLESGSNHCNFLTPTVTIGNTVDGSSELSNWTLTSGSYLTIKGVATSRLTDKAEYTFATPPAVGAYEYVRTPQTITFGPLSAQTYGVADYDPGATASSGLTPVYTSSQPSVATIVNGKIHFVGVGTTSITATQPGDAYYGVATNVSQSLTISAKALTVTSAAAVSKTYDGSNAAVITGTLTGVAYSDDVTLVGTGTFASTAVGTNIAVTSTSTLGGAKAANYTLTQPTGLTACIQYGITASPNNGVMGGVTGAGNYDSGATVTLTATPTNGTYHFVNWTESAVEVSTNTVLSFSASANRTLVANFSANAISSTGPISVSDPTLGNCSTCDVTLTSGTLTVDVDKTLHNLTLNTGTKLDLGSHQLTVTDLTLMAGKTTSAAISVTHAMTVNGTMKLLKTLDNAVWYFISFPCDVAINSITQVSGSGVLGAIGSNWWIKYYDGESRSQSLPGSNWKAMSAGGTLQANKGYIIGLANALTDDYVLSFPLNTTLLSSAEVARTITVTPWGEGTASESNVGWNLVGHPYLSRFSGSGVGATYLTMYNGSSYDQYLNTSVAGIYPFSAYFIQASALGTTSSLGFAIGDRQLAPGVVRQLSDNIQLNLSTSTGDDKTVLIVADHHNDKYVINSDLEKWLTTGTDKPQIFSLLGGINYAYNAVPISSVDKLPLGLYTRSAVDATISANIAQSSLFSKLLLLDKVSNIETDLLTSDYSFKTNAALTSSRFELTAVQLPTSNSAKVAGSDVLMTISNNQLKISNLPIGGVVRIYDTMGRLVSHKLISNSVFELPLVSKGMHTVQLESASINWVGKIVNQ